jgi:4'-phosphopantetheinyl transferase
MPGNKPYCHLLTDKLMITIYYSLFNKELDIQLLGRYRELLPESLRSRNGRFVNWRDRYSNLFGKLLLLHACREKGIKEDVLKGLQYSWNGRPFHPELPDFNISHSSEAVVCAISNDARLGIDIEKITRTDFGDFADVMSPDQWDLIRHSPDPLKTFYDFWTIKESVIKADSRGLELPLQEISIHGNSVFCTGRLWYIKQLSIVDGYSCCLANTLEETPVTLKEINLYENSPLLRLLETKIISNPVNQM